MTCPQLHREGQSPLLSSGFPHHISPQDPQDRNTRATQACPCAVCILSDLSSQGLGFTPKSGHHKFQRLVTSVPGATEGFILVPSVASGPRVGTI